MEPVLTPEEMAAVDTAAADCMGELVQRAGWAVAREALEMLGGAYGRRVHVVAGPGNNGADGRVAVERLRERGVRATLGAHNQTIPHAPNLDLVIDAAFGTGLSRPYDPPPLPAGVRVLAVDIPSGLDGRTGVFCGTPWRADATVTFAALKTGLLLGHGPDYCGRVRVADIGLSVEAEVGTAGALTRALITDDDVVRCWPRRAADAHKWQSAVWVIGGAPGMTGAAALVAEAAGRAGSGYVLVGSPQVDAPPAPLAPQPPAQLPTEAVTRALEGTEWPARVADERRVGALVVGNGLGRGRSLMDGVVSLMAASSAPMVLDADALGGGGSALVDACAHRPAPTVLTPHDGEYEALMGEPPGDDRLAATLHLAERSGSIALLKGPTTVVAAPDGRVRLVSTGDERLATAGTGDVLAGMIGAALACGADAFEAAALAAHLHGRAARRGLRAGFRAGDLPELVARVLDELLAGAAVGRAT
ncbi:MAG: NAD(P)H-hydrate dehydratase [Microthrixaceae bacterium]